MTSLSSRSNRRPNLLLTLGVGGGIGALVALALYVTKNAVYVALLPVAMLLIIPTALIKNYRLYWFTILLLTLQLKITKNINDGLTIVDSLKIDYVIDTLTFDVTLTDLVFIVLMAFWANDLLFHAKPIRFPAVSWLAVAYIVICLLSTIGAPSPYLGLVAVVRQCKFFLVYLFAFNCLDSKGALRVLTIVGVTILVVQAGVTVTRFETGYFTPIGSGDSHQDEDQIKNYLTVDRGDASSAVRAFGTLGSPNATTRLCLLVIPLALFLCAPNPMFRMRWVFAGLTAFGLAALVLTFTRVYYISTAVQVLLAFLIMARDRMLKRDEVVLVVLLVLAALVAASPKIYEQFTVRENSISVRALQNETAFEMTLDHPFLGTGLNNAPEVMRKYTKLTYDESDANTQFQLEPINNMFLSMTAEIGVFGTLAFIAFFASAALTAWRQSRRSPDPEIRLFACMMVVAFCGVAVNGALDPFDEYQVLTLLWLYAGLSFGLPNIAQRRDALASQPGHRMP